jgi:hypothetical protein
MTSLSTWLRAAAGSSGGDGFTQPPLREGRLRALRARQAGLPGYAIPLRYAIPRGSTLAGRHEPARGPGRPVRTSGCPALPRVQPPGCWLRKRDDEE